jgi:hypothetical protein
MRFEEAYSGWEGGRLRQDEAARLLGQFVRRSDVVFSAMRRIPLRLSRCRPLRDFA